MIELTKIRIKSPSDVVIEWVEFHVDEEGQVLALMKNEHSVKYRHVVHEDFLKELSHMRRHVIAICEMHKCRLDLGEIPEEVINTVEVTGVSMGGEDDKAGVVIIAKRKLKSGKYLNIVTPFVQLAREEDYKHVDILAQDLEDLMHEARAYMGGKWGEKQMQLEFETNKN